MTFLEYLRVKKNIDTESRDLGELMDEYYDEYSDFLQGLKDGCSQEQ